MSQANEGASPATAQEGAGGTAPAPDAGAPAAPATGTAPEGAAPAAPGHWAGGLPEQLQKAFTGVGSLEEAAKIFERGRGYLPASKPEDVALTWPDGVTPDADFVKKYQKFAVESGLTPAQAQKAVDFAARDAAEKWQAAIAAGEKDLAARYPDVGKLKTEATAAFTWIDREMGGRLSQSAGVAEVMNNPAMVEALAMIQKRLGEDSLGRGTGTAGADGPMDAEAFYKTKFPEGGNS